VTTFEPRRTDTRHPFEIAEARANASWDVRGGAPGPALLCPVAPDRGPGRKSVGHKQAEIGCWDAPGFPIWLYPSFGVAVSYMGDAAGACENLAFWQKAGVPLALRSLSGAPEPDSAGSRVLFVCCSFSQLFRRRRHPKLRAHDRVVRIGHGSARAAANCQGNTLFAQTYGSGFLLMA
jgi:hypothetical protein